MLFNIASLIRPAFKHTIPFCQECPCSVMALTATATPDVQKELISSLNNPVLTIASVNQPNIFYSVHKLELLGKIVSTCVILYLCFVFFTILIFGWFLIPNAYFCIYF